MANLKNFDSKVDENAQLIDVLSRNSDILNKVSRFKDHFERLNDLQKKLMDLNVLVNKDISSSEIVKVSNHAAMID